MSLGQGLGDVAAPGSEEVSAFRGKPGGKTFAAEAESHTFLRPAQREAVAGGVGERQQDLFLALGKLRDDHQAHSNLLRGTTLRPRFSCGAGVGDVPSFGTDPREAPRGRARLGP